MTPKIKKLLLILSSLFSFLLILLMPPLSSKSALRNIGENPEAVKALAQCLNQKKATMYGSANCGHCKAQKEMFGPYFKNVRFVDCRASRAYAKECNEAKVGKFPQWNFDNGQRIVREASLDEIARKSGCQAYVAQALGQQDSNFSESNLAQETYSSKSQKSKSDEIYSPEYGSLGNSLSEKSSAAKVSKAKSMDAAGKSDDSSIKQTSSVYGSTEELAQCLKAKDVKFYGSPKCIHCNKQKEMFDGAFEKYLKNNFHNCKGSPSEQAECSKKGTFPFPTWVESGTGKKLLGPERSLEQIAKTFNCTLAARQMDDETNKKDQPESASDSDASLSTAKDVADEESKTETPKDLPASSNQDLEQKQEKLVNCLLEREIVLYGVLDSSRAKEPQIKATKDQLSQLGSKAKQIKMIDCSSQQAECSGIMVYPTWVLENKKELPGVYDLSNLAQILNCPLD